MARLVNCMQRAMTRIKDEEGNTRPVLDHLMKRGIIAEAHRLAATEEMGIQEAEIQAVRDIRDKTVNDIAKVEAALAAPPKTKAPSKPRASQASAPRRPVEREVKTRQAIARMHETPEEAFQLAHRVRAGYERARAKTKEMIAKAKPGQAETVEHVRAFAELNALVSALPPEVRGRIGGTVTLAKLRGRGQSIENFLAGRVEQMDKELETYFQKIYRDRIDTLLKRKQPKRAPSGVKKSTIGADAQDVVNRVAGYVKMSIDDVLAEVQKIEAEIMAGGLEPEVESARKFRQMELNTFGDTSQMTATQLEAAYNSLSDTIKRGQAAWGAQEESRLEDQRNKSGEIVSVLPKSTESGVRQRNRAYLTNWLGNFARNHVSFLQIINRLFPGVSFADDWTNQAATAQSRDTDFQWSIQTRLITGLQAALGGKSQQAVGRVLKQMTTESNIPVPDGGTATKMEAIQFLYAWGQPDVRQRMMNAKAPWTEEAIKVLQDATSDPASQFVMKFLPQIYEEIYQKADAVYVNHYGMHLPRIQGIYAPMRYRSGSSSDVTLTGAPPSSGVTPKALMTRVKHSAELLQSDALEVFFEHVNQMSHWIHFANLVRETRGVLNNVGVKRSVEQDIGRDGVANLGKQLDAVTRLGAAKSGEVKGLNAFIAHLSSGVAISALAFNYHSAAVQADSSIRWMFEIPIERWAGALLGHNWIKNVAKAWHSPTIQRRIHKGSSAVVRDIMEKNNLNFSMLARLVDIGFWHLNMFDAAATAVSSAIVYTDAVNQGMSEEQALQKMDVAVAKFSQPTTPQSQAQALVTANAFTKMYLMFMADPTLKTSLTMEGMMEIGRGNWEKGMRNIMAVQASALVSQFVLQCWAAAFGGGDDDELEGLEHLLDIKKYIRAMVLAPLQGIFVMGNVAEGVARLLFSEKWWAPSTPAGHVAENVRKILNHWDDLMTLDPSDPDFQKEVMNIIQFVGPIAGGGMAAMSGAWKRGTALYNLITGEEE